MDAHQNQARVMVIGAGITGLSVSLCLSQLYKGRATVTVVADKYSPHTTSDSSGGLVIPSFSSYGTRERGKQAGEVVNDRLQGWAYATYDHLLRLREEGVRPEDGLMLVPAYKYFEDPCPVPEWASHVLDFRSLEASEAAALGLRTDLFKTIWRFMTFVIDGKRFLPWMMRRVAEEGGVRFETRKVTSLRGLSKDLDCDVVVNCAGLGSRELAGDEDLYPVKGQVVAVDAPGFEEVHYHHEGDLHPEYVIPRMDCVLLGSTTEGDTWSTETEPHVVEGIYKKCVGLVPRLAGSRVVGSWGCLRPVRHPEVRVEVEEGGGGGGGVPVVHCYGHGGQGYILHWGTAMEAVRLVGACLERREGGNVKSSKL